MFGAGTHSQGFACHGQPPRQLRNHRHIVWQHGLGLQELTGRCSHPAAAQHQVSQLHAQGKIMRRSLREFLESSLRSVPLTGFEELFGLLPQASFLRIGIC